MAGIMDKLKGLFGGAKDSANVDKLKETAGQMKDKADGLVEQHSDKIPDSVEKTYDKVSDQAEKIIPGDGADAGDTPAADPSTDPGTTDPGEGSAKP